MKLGLRRFYGAGNQEWFRRYAEEETDSCHRKDHAIEGLPRKKRAALRRNAARLADYGCGLVALTDLKDYLDHRTEGKREDYLYRLSRLDRWSMHAFPHWGTGALQLLFHFRQHAASGKGNYTAFWYSGRKLLEKTEEMLRNDIPVILCAGPGLRTAAQRKDGGREIVRGILLKPAEQPERDRDGTGWTEGSRIRGNAYGKQAEGRKELCIDAHYMTVTDLYYREGKKIFGLYSWGSYWETDAEAFVRGMLKLPIWFRFFSGILYIRKKQK